MSKLNIRVYYEDTDSGGVVYYANYLKFIERGRAEFLRELGLEQDELKKQNIIFVVKKITADYVYPARLDDLISVQTYIKKVGFASVIFSQKIVNSKQNKVLFTTQVIVACLSTDSLKPCIIPDLILEKING